MNQVGILVLSVEQMIDLMDLIIGKAATMLVIIVLDLIIQENTTMLVVLTEIKDGTKIMAIPEKAKPTCIQSLTSFVNGSIL